MRAFLLFLFVALFHSLHASENMPIKQILAGKFVQCTTSRECPGRLVCRQGQCAETGHQSGCNNDSDCPGSQVCRNDRCIENQTPPQNGGSGSDCTSSSQCNGSLSCRRGI